MSLAAVTLAGLPYEIGQQHGRHMSPLRPLLAKVMATRLAALRHLDADRPARSAPVIETLEILDRPLLEFLSGLAAELALAADDLLRYTLSSYLLDLAKVTAAAMVEENPAIAALVDGAVHGATAGDGLYSASLAAALDGCTTWAASGITTLDGRPLLVKNRDYHQDHIPLQFLAGVIPAQGYRYLSLGSAGSPNVFSSGINERGLAVADTHVLSRDIGPGLPRFSLMREILEQHETTASALDYLRSIQHMGAGTLTLADAIGHLAVWECGHLRSGCREAKAADGSFSVAPSVVSTNHFVTPELVEQWVEDESPLLVGNSLARHERVAAALADSAGSVDIAWAQQLMRAHGTPQDALCRHPIDVDGQHPHPGLERSTISTALFLPAGLPDRVAPGPVLLMATGLPCRATWATYQMAL